MVTTLGRRRHNNCRYFHLDDADFERINLRRGASISYAGALGAGELDLSSVRAGPAQVLARSSSTAREQATQRMSAEGGMATLVAFA